jgi:acyl transferase domain-containing protein
VTNKEIHQWNLGPQKSSKPGWSPNFPSGWDSILTRSMSGNPSPATVSGRRRRSAFPVNSPSGLDEDSLRLWPTSIPPSKLSRAIWPIAGGAGVNSRGLPNRAATTEPIAIIGIGCRFPGAHGAEAFWQLLRTGVDAITEVPAERFDLHAFYDPDPAAPGKINTRWGGFLDQVDRFDPHFFGISPREALRMDPQQRLLLEVTWEALRRCWTGAGASNRHHTGVFIGISTNDYSRIQFSDLSCIDAYAGTGNAMSIAANRISYLFDFRGPSIAIDTACSSSLVAVHLACSSLWNGESTLALAGGVNLILSPAITINFTKAGAMAPDGRCKAFDARANGYVRSEGAGLVVLKPLSRALADGDPIYAVIRGSAVNQDGRSNGLMAPNPLAQEAVLREAYRRAGVSPGQVQYVEAHGTGTFLGDPIEAKALGTVLAVDRPPRASLRPGIGQNQPGSPRGRRRRCRLDQGGAGAESSGNPAEPALSGAQPAYPFR